MPKPDAKKSSRTYPRGAKKHTHTKATAKWGT